MNGEVGDVVLWVCPGGNAHNSSADRCEAGDVHAGVVSEVQTRDAKGHPQRVLLALMVPPHHTVFWITAERQRRQAPGTAAQVMRLTRGAPPKESATPFAARVDDNGVLWNLDFTPGTWHLQAD